MQQHLKSVFGEMEVPSRREVVSWLLVAHYLPGHGRKTPPPPPGRHLEPTERPSAQD